MASQRPYPIDHMPVPDDAPASETETTSPPAGQSAVTAPETPPESTPDPAPAEPVTNADDPARPAPAATPGADPAPAAPFGPKSVRGGNMAMRVLSRAMQDLDVVTGGTRAATYDEVDEYVGRAIRIEQALEGAAIANQTPARPSPASDPDAPRGGPVGEKTMSPQTDGSGIAGAGNAEGADANQTTAIGDDDLQDNEAVDGSTAPTQGSEDQGIAGGGGAARGGEGVNPEALAPQIKPAVLFRMTGSAADNRDATDHLHSLNPALDAEPVFSEISERKSAQKPKRAALGARTVRNGIKYQDWGGDIAAAQGIMEQYPALMKKFARSDIIVAVVPDNVAQYPIRNPGGTAPGWRAGTTVKDVPAMFYDDHVVILAPKKIVGQSLKYRTLHELGHALDYMTTSLRGLRSSSEDQFKEVYAADLPALKKIDKIHYFDDNTARGRSEIYADSFSRMKVDRALLQTQLPHIYVYWAKRGW